MNKLYLLGLVLLAACDITALSPGDRCGWLRTPAFHTDTIWNQVKKESLPDSVQSQWRPYFLFQQQIGWADSTRVCN